jgi:alpha-ketoglutarate-dependent taurine dioxygenase
VDPTSRKLSPHVGLEIIGAVGADLVEPSAANALGAALDGRGVIVYRELHIGDDDLVALSRLLGEVVVPPTREHRLPEIATITLDASKTSEALAYFRRGNFLWHIDGASDSLPQKATLLTAREIDDAGGDTEFASTYAAYEALPDADKELIADLQVVHRFGAAQRLAHPDVSTEEQESWRRWPDRVHPLVWTRPNGRRSLLLGATADEVVGWPAEEGRALLDRLLAWSTRPEFVLRHQWRPGDLVIWDNTGMLHRVMPFEPTSRRVMHRTTLVGELAVT